MSSLRPSRVRWLLIFWLFVLSAVAFLDRVNISIAGTSISETYGLSNVQLGAIFSSFLLGYALFQPVAGWLADRLGARHALAAGVLWWGIFTALTAALPSTFPFALLILISIRFFLGAGEAVVYPASNQFVGRWIPSHERGIANGWIFAGVGAGAGLAPPLVTYVMIHFGWRWSFWLCAIIGVVAGVVWYMIARDTPDEHPLVSASELEQIHSGLTVRQNSANSTKRDAGVLLPWSAILASKEVWAITFAYFCYGYVAWIFFSWFYIYLAKVRGLDLKASAFYAMLPFLAMAACCPLGGLVSDSLTKWRGKRVGRCGLAVVAMILAAAFLAFGSTVASARVASVVLAGGAGALYLSQSSFWSVTADIGGASCGSVSGVMNMGAQLGGALTASLTPAIAARYGWTASFWAAVICCLLGALSWLLVDPTREISFAKPPLAMRASAP